MELVTSPREFVAYYRVSTDRQGQSGLGLDAQRNTVATYLHREGGRLVQEFVEVESGRIDNRPQLEAAVNFCKKHRVTLVVAKLDRLYRNVHFISKLMEDDIQFVACDNPHANKLTIHMLSAVAEYEAELISQRTSAALQALKARGVKLGSPNPRIGAQAAGKVISDKADDFAARVRPTIELLRKGGCTTFRAIAAALNKSGIKTARGGRWFASTVRNTEMRRVSPSRTELPPPRRLKNRRIAKRGSQHSGVQNKKQDTE